MRILRDSEIGTSCVLLSGARGGKERSVAVEWQVRDEANAVVQEGQAGPGLSAVEVRFLNGQRHVRVEIPAPRDLSLGYYNLTVRTEGLVGGIVGN